MNLETPAQFKGNETFYRTMLRKLVNELPTEWAPFAAAAADTESLKNFVHKIKGVAGNLSVSEVYLSAQLLEAALRDNKPDSELYRAFTEACDAFRNAVSPPVA